MEIEELYQELIIDHGTAPRNLRALQPHSHDAKGFNPLCGDKVHVYLQVEDKLVKDLSFQGSGCAISMASASIMTEILKGKPLPEAQRLLQAFLDLMRGEQTVTNDMGKLAALSGVKQFPSRVKCATLAWHALENALHKDSNTATTE